MWKESLRAEIRSFESIVNHHPEVTKYKLESESLKNEIQRLRAFLAQSIDNINLTELEKVFLEISESKGIVFVCVLLFFVVVFLFECWQYVCIQSLLRQPTGCLLYMLKSFCISRDVVFKTDLRCRHSVASCVHQWDSLELFFPQSVQIHSLVYNLLES